MAFKSRLLKPIAKRTAYRIARWRDNALSAQEEVLQRLIKKGQKTSFGQDHDFGAIKEYKDYKDRVPIRDYEALRPWVDRVKKGEQDVLWPGRPKYFAKTSGTTSGVKYIPLTADSLPNHFGTARNALFNHVAMTGRADWMDGKLIFLSGSPILELTGNIPTGRLSGIVNHEIPAWLRRNQMPTLATNCVEEWEEKVEEIVTETLQEDMTLISGIPPWVQMYYERLLDRTGKKFIKDIFPNFSMFVYGGVNFEPYRASMESLVGKRLDSVETYPASEGFIAFQDQPDNHGLLLNVKSGIYFEFVPADEIFNENPTRLSLEDVETGVNYAILLSTTAGLWSYNIGDTVEFVSLDPYRIIVSGRVKHFISAFGEHVIGKEVDEAMLSVARDMGVNIVEFTVAPQVAPPEGGLPYHEWLVEFEQIPENLSGFAQRVDEQMTRQNIYYADLINGNILQKLKITPLQRDAFRQYMKSKGKLGGQNKVPRLSNDRKIAEELTAFSASSPVASAGPNDSDQSLQNINTSSMIKQFELLEKVRPLMGSHGQPYRKYKNVFARKATAGEEIQTITKDGLETVNRAVEGDYIVRNQTDAKEMYLMNEKKFRDRYCLLNDEGDEFCEYYSIGKITGLELTADVLRKLNLADEFHFEAPWGEAMIAKLNDFLAFPPGGQEVYRIARIEFFETYKLDESQ